MKKEMSSRWYVEVIDNSFGYVSSWRIYIPWYSDVNHSKCLKKLWKRYCKLTQYMNDIFISAFIESEDGSLQDMSQFWIFEEWRHMEEKGVLPDEIPFA